MFNVSIFRIFEKCALYQLYPVASFKFQQEEGALSKYCEYFAVLQLQLSERLLY